MILAANDSNRGKKYTRSGTKKYSTCAYPKHFLNVSCTGGAIDIWDLVSRAAIPFPT